MKRELLTEEQLLEWMNKELAQYDQCEDCRFDSVMRLQGEDGEGCNWSSANMRCSGVPCEVCEPHATRVALAAKKKFNLM